MNALYDIDLTDIDGRTQKLGAFAGKALRTGDLAATGMAGTPWRQQGIVVEILFFRKRKS